MNLGLQAVWRNLDSLLGLGLVSEARTTGKNLSDVDAGKLITVTGTVAIGFPSPKAVGTNWAVVIKNSSTGVITVAPVLAGETLDGLSTYAMYSQEVRLFYKTATEIRSIVLNIFDHAFTTVGANTFVKPPGYTTFEGEMWNGGCSGFKGAAGGTASGGAGAGCFPFSLPASLLGTTETLTVGAGGVGQTVASSNGFVGGATSLGSLIVMAVAPNYATTTNPYIIESPNGIVIYSGSQSFAAAVPFATFYGGAAGGTCNVATLWGPGTSKVGGNGGVASLAASGTDGAAPGGGGGATLTGAQSGAGARGEIRIRGKI